MNDLTQSPHSETHKWFKVVLFAGMLLFAFYASTHMVAAGDTWVALACGRHFSNHSVDTVEPFSFNSHHAGPTEEDIAKWPGWAQMLCKPFSLEAIQKWHPTGWINQNWLTHLIFYKLASWFGHDGNYNYNTLVYWKFAIYFITVFCVYAIGKVLGAGDFLSAAAACMAMVVGRTFFDIRPAGYSNLLVPVYILVLVLATYRNYRLIWLIVPLVVFWANVHGGYLYAFIMLVPFIGVHLLLRLPKRWTICVGVSGLWLLLYLMSYKFITGYISKIEYFSTQLQELYVWSDAQTAQFLKTQIDQVFTKYDPYSISLINDKFFWTWIVLAGASVVFTCFKQVKTGIFYFFHLFVGGIYFIGLLLSRFNTSSSGQLPKYFASDASSSLITFCLVYITGAVILLLLALRKDRFVVLPMKGIYHAIAAGVAGFIAMIIFNPFHLTNLTHTFEISVSKHAESWRQVNEWKPAFDWMDKTTTTPNPVGDEEWFGIFVVLTIIALTIWILGHLLKPRPTVKDKRRNRTSETEAETFEWPKIDLAVIIISLLTLYMAIRSRRFIAMAGSAATPIVFLMILQVWQMFSIRISRHKKGLFETIPIGLATQTYLRYAVLLTVLGLSVVWGMKYKHIYLDPWPSNNQYHSVFMRMTASYLKPFEVCQFINDNQIKGRVFNYWTEGGAIAFGQKPDPETGQIPLKLFMDGRAQAAYNHDKFRLWQLIHSGGPMIREARLKGRKIDSETLKDSGRWIDTQLRDYNVWVVLMPQSQENSIFMQALRKTNDWITAYIDNTQHLLVNANTPQGKNLLDSIVEATAVFPNAYSRNLSTASVITETRNAAKYKDLYPLTKAAFDENPSPIATLAMRGLTGLPMFGTKIIDDLKHYTDDFVRNKNSYMQKNGGLMRLTSAQIAAQTLSRINSQEKERYEKYSSQFKEEASLLGKEYVW